MFHEFGHALNIALSHTKYQYLSGARGTTDMIEIPSHFTEMFLTDYSFVRQFAMIATQLSQKDRMQLSEEESLKTQMLPIDRSIFNKMLFCDRIFDFIELEESLYFTALDVELHSFGRDKPEINLNDILEINHKHLSAMSVNLRTRTSNKAGSDSSQAFVQPMSDTKEIDKIIEESLFTNSYATDDCYRSIAEILFGNSATVTEKPKDIFAKLSEQDSVEQLGDEYELDTQKSAKFARNFLFCRFHHLFEYEATYYSYLIAKLCSRKLFSEGLSTQVGSGQKTGV